MVEGSLEVFYIVFSICVTGSVKIQLHFHSSCPHQFSARQLEYAKYQLYYHKTHNKSLFVEFPTTITTTPANKRTTTSASMSLYIATK